MADHSAIEWTDATWNPVRGCTKVSQGCAHCYAETFAERFRGVKGHPYEQGFDLRLVPEKLAEPLSWRKPRRVFVNSMSDLFQDGVPDEYIDQVFAVMALAPQHTFQVLTKRAVRMRKYFSSEDRRAAIAEQWWDLLPGPEPKTVNFSLSPLDTWPLPNVWLGVSVENQHFADERIPLLLATPSAVRFISAEPLLEDVDLTPHLHGDTLAAPGPSGFRKGPRLDWVIVGGESGPGARPFCLSWARNIVHDCADAGVGCFVKQLGTVPYETTPEDGWDGVCQWPIETRLQLRDRKGGDLTEWPEDLRVREWPAR